MNRKLTQKHIDEIQKLLPDMIIGKINVKEAQTIVNKMARENELPEISTDTIKKHIRKTLKDEPEKLEEFNYTLVHNAGKRNPVTIRISEEKLNQKIIEEDLPMIFDEKTTISDIAIKRKLSERKTRDIIENYLKSDNEKFEIYKSIMKKNCGAPPKKRIKANAKKSRVESANIVENREFELLPKEKKRKQIVYKYLKMKMNETENAHICNEETVDNKIQNLVSFFESRTKNIDGKADIKEDDSLIMMYKVPTLLNYSMKEKIVPALQTLEKNEQLGRKNAYHIVKTFPSILGYTPERTSKQLQILEESNLIDAIIDVPRRLMESPQLMYAQIEYAKERHHTADLSTIKRSNIFAGNDQLRRLYGTSIDEIKERFPLKEKKVENNVRFSEQEIGKKTVEVSTELKEKAEQIIENKLKDNTLNKDDNQI